MKKSYRRNKQKKGNEKFETFLLKDWDEFQEEEEEHIDDLLDEYHIPEIEFLEPIDKPEELTFN